MKANWRSSLDTLEVLNIVSRWFNNWQPMISFLLLTLQVCIKWRSLGPNRWGLERSYSYMLLRSPHHAWSHFEGGGFDPPQGILDHVSGGMSDEKKNAGLMVKLGMFSAWDVLYFQYSQVTFVPVWRWFWLPGILGSAPTSPLLRKNCQVELTSQQVSVQLKALPKKVHLTSSLAKVQPSSLLSSFPWQHDLGKSDLSQHLAVKILQLWIVDITNNRRICSRYIYNLFLPPDLVKHPDFTQLGPFFWEDPRVQRCQKYCHWIAINNFHAMHQNEHGT